MSTAIEPVQLVYPEKADANGYAKKYYKRRAFYFGAHNSPESYVLFGEWKRRLVESGVATEVKTIRKDLAQQASPSTAAQLGGPAEQKPVQFALMTGVIAVILFAVAFGAAQIVSSKLQPTVDGKVLTSEEMDFIRGVRMHRSDLKRGVATEGERIAELADRLMEMGPENAKAYLSKAGI